MTTVNLGTKIVSGAATSSSFQAESRSGLALEVTLQSSAGVAHNGSAGRVALYLGRAGKNQDLLAWVRGVASGVYSVAAGTCLTVPRLSLVCLDSVYSFGVWWEPDSGTPVLLYTGDLQIIASQGGTVDLTPTAAVVPTLPPIQQTLEIIGVLDVLGTAGTVPSEPPVRVPLGVPTPIRLTVASLSGAGADAQARGTLRLSSLVSGVRTAIGGPVTLLQTSPSSGIFEGLISNAVQSALGSNLVAQYAITLTANGVNYFVRSLSEITFIDEGFPANPLPVLVLTSPAPGVIVPPGPLSIGFTCLDDDGTLTSDNFAAIDGGVVVEGAASISSGNGTSSVVGTIAPTLATAGAHTVGVRCTDNLSGVANATRTVTVQQPILTITSPTTLATVDSGQLLVAAVTDPAMPSGTALRVYEDTLPTATLLGTGTLGEGVLTSALSARSYTIHAEVTTEIGVAASSPITVTAANQAPVIEEITAPTSGQAVAVGSATVTCRLSHASGLGVIQSVRARFGSGTWAALSRVGETDVYTSAVVQTGTVETAATVTIEVVDQSPTTTTGSVSVVVTRDVTWSNTVSFAAAADSAQTATSGAVTLNFDVTGAVDGRTWRLRFPAGVASISTDIVSGASSVFAAVAAPNVLPSGWRYEWDISIATAWGQTSQGAIMWTPGVAYTLLVQCDVATQRLLLSAEITEEVALTGWTHRWTLDNTLACVNPVGGAAIPAANALLLGTPAPTFVADPGDGVIADRSGSVALVTSGGQCVRLPVTRGGGSWTIAGWYFLAADVTALANGFCSPYGCTENIDGLWVGMDGTDPCVLIGPTVVSHLAQHYGDVRGRWFHFCRQWDALRGHEIVHVNGRLVTDAAFDHGGLVNPDVTTGWTVGGHVGALGGMTPQGGNCYVREVAVAAALLTSAQIQAHLRATRPAAVASPPVAVEMLGSSLSNANELSDPVDAALGVGYAVRGGGVGGSSSDLDWPTSSYVTQIPQALQRLAIGARTIVHHDPGLMVNGVLGVWGRNPGGMATGRAVHWGEMLRLARIGAAPITHVMTGHATSDVGYEVRAENLVAWRTLAPFSVIDAHWLGAIGLTGAAYATGEQAGVRGSTTPPDQPSGDAGPHLSAAGRGTIATRLAAVLQAATGVTP